MVTVVEGGCIEGRFSNERWQLVTEAVSMNGLSHLQSKLLVNESDSEITTPGDMRRCLVNESHYPLP